MGEYFKNWFGRSKTPPDRGRLDPWLWMPTAALLCLGLLMVLNTTYFLSLAKTGDGFHYFKLQLAHIAVGLVALAVLSQFSLTGLRRIVTPLMILAAVMLIAVKLPHLGVVRGGARRWLRLGPLVIEPSELVKFALIFFLADFLSRRENRIEQFADGPLPVFIAVGVFALLVLRQPDFGTTVIIVLVMFAMLFAAGARLAHLAAAGAVALIGLIFQAMARSYRLRRLTAFMHPWKTARGAGFQLVQSLIALGAGGEWGVGLGVGRQKMFYLPQAHTDFIFAVVGEELGLVGAAAVIGLFGVILMRGMRIAHEEPDTFGSLLAVGLTSVLSIQAAIHIAVVIGLIPTKGLPLPFLSYGGSATVIALAELGVLLALARRPAVRLGTRR